MANNGITFSNNKHPQGTEKKNRFVSGFAASMIMLSAIIVILLIVTSKEYIKSNGHHYNTISKEKKLLTMLLPFLIIWIGTLIAYFFLKKKPEDSNKNSKNLTKLIDHNVDYKIQTLKEKGITKNTNNTSLLLFEHKEVFNKKKLPDLMKKTDEKNAASLQILEME